MVDENLRNDSIGDETYLYKKPKVPKKKGIKLKIKIQNGINKILEDCDDTKEEIVKLNKKINLFDYFCQKSVNNSTQILKGRLKKNKS